MKQVKAYESSDGVLFSTREACIRHEQHEKLIKWLEENRPCYNPTAVDLADWLLDNKNTIQTFLEPFLFPDPFQCPS